MTEQEAAALAERLTRVWSTTANKTLVKTPPHERWPLWEEALWHFNDENEDFRFLIPLTQHVYCSGASLDDEDQELEFCLVLREDSSPKEFLSFNSPCAVPTYADCTQLADEYLPFFRRGCWLSGCAIEASAHEKAEWMQGFTREEVEAWNLKM